MILILKNIVDEYEVSPTKTVLGLVDYNGPANPRVFFNENYNKENFKRFAETIPKLNGGTLGGALKVVREDVFTLQRGERPFAEDIVVVMSEGNFDENAPEIKDEIALLREKPVKIIAIGITDKPDRNLRDKIKVLTSGDDLVVLPHEGGERNEAKKVPIMAAEGQLTILDVLAQLQ